MDPTALITFIFRAPADAYIVELLGSWDNFARPYRMHHDKKRGPGTFTGCFKFEDIVHDGFDLQWSRPRTGGLRQGGTYWYYYRINLEDESYSDCEPCTTSCPFLPGQVLNILDIPLEIMDIPSRCQSAGGDIVGTLNSIKCWPVMDPATRYDYLKPPPISRIHQFCVSDEALDGRLENTEHPSHRPIVSQGSDVYSYASSLSQYSKNGDSSPKHDDPYHDEWDFFPNEEDGHPDEEYDEYFTNLELEYDPDDESLPYVPYPHLAGPTPLHMPGESRSLPRDLDPRSTHAHLPALPRTAWSDDINYATFNVVDTRTRRECRTSIERFTKGSFTQRATNTDDAFDGTTAGHEQQRSPRRWRPWIRLRSLSRDRAPVATSPSSARQMETYVSKVRSQSFNDHTHQATFDFTSPTLSGATISTAGEQTPFSISPEDPFTGHVIHEHDGGQAIDAIIKRLKSLGHAQDAHDSVAHDVAEPASNSIILQTDTSLDVPSAMPSTLLVPNETWPKSVLDMSLSIVETTSDLPKLEQTSFSDDIFSELGYLGESII